MPCSNKVTTSSGTFTAYNNEMTRCEAKKFCQKKGHILAPITSQVDKDAVLKMLDQNCPQHKGNFYYHTGLDLTYCGKKQERIFTNGVKYDEGTHGTLYTGGYKHDSKCPLAYMASILDRSLLIAAKPNCYPQNLRVVCLDQSTAVASPVVQEKPGYYKVSSAQALVAVGGFCAVFGCLVLAIGKNKQLKKELNELKNDF